MADNLAAGSAYMFVTIAMMTLFLLVMLTTDITASSRRISGHYMRFAGLYNLAVAGGEYLHYIFDKESYERLDDLVYEAKGRLADEDFELYLRYDEGLILLEGLFLPLLREAKSDYLSGFIADNFERRGRGHVLSYSVNVATGTYTVRTYFWQQGAGAYRLFSEARKSVPGSQSSPPTWIVGRLDWPDVEYDAVLRPTGFGWRSGIPDWFLEGTHPGADLPGNFSALPGHSWSAENPLLITNNPWINTAAFQGIPSLIIYTGAGELHIYGASLFEGIIIAAGDIYIEGTVHGSVVAGGAIEGDDFFAYHSGDPFFSIPLELETQRMVLEYLGFTRFGQAAGRESDVRWLLGDVIITGFELDVYFQEKFVPRLYAVQQTDLDVRP